MKELGIDLRCAVQPRAHARLEPDYRVRVNHELFWFGSANARKQFSKKPWRYCGVLTDPVTRARFEPDRKSPSVVHEGRRFYFASDETKAVFARDPAMYRDPRPEMRKAAADSSAAASEAGDAERD